MSFLRTHGPWLVFMTVLTEILFSLLAYRWYTHQHAPTNEYIQAGNPDFPRHQMLQDPTQGRIALVHAPFEGGAMGQCSGSLVGPDLVLTAAHCLAHYDPQGEFRIYLGLHHSGGGYNYDDQCDVRALTIGTYGPDRKDGTDYALLQITSCTRGDHQPGLRSGWYQVSGEDVPVGAEITALGYPGSEKRGTLWASPGARTNICHWLCNPRSYRAEMRISGGNSGGPVLRGGADGETVVGVISGVNSEGTTFVQKIEPALVELILKHNDQALP